MNKKETKTMRWWLLILAVAAIAVVAGRIRRQSNRSRPGGRERTELGMVILDAYSADWSQRLAVSPAALRQGVEGRDATLASRIDAEVGIVDLRFSEPGGARSKVQATAMVTYAGTPGRSVAEIELAWDDVPGGVRAELIRKPGGTVFRKWRAASA